MEAFVDNIVLTEEQLAAGDLLLAALAEPGGRASLSGYAGTGKSVLTGYILESFADQCPTAHIILASPTGKAARRQTEVTGRSASTMHRLLYWEASSVQGELQFRKPKPTCAAGDLLIIDEASMISEDFGSTFEEWTPAQARILYVGDPGQLPPVAGRPFVDLEHATARLNTVHRQQDGGVLSYATWIRQGRGAEWEETLYDEAAGDVQVYHGIDSAIAWTLHQRKAEADAVTLVGTHKTRVQINSAVRKALALEGELCVGDNVILRTNSRITRLVNGDIGTVLALRETLLEGFRAWEIRLQMADGEAVIYTPQGLVDADSAAYQKWLNFRQRWKLPVHLVHYAQALTVHSAQGSQWESVGFVRDSMYRRALKEQPEFAKQFAYTAVTRASRNLAVFV